MFQYFRFNYPFIISLPVDQCLSVSDERFELQYNELHVTVSVTRKRYVLDNNTVIVNRGLYVRV